jgi:putative membrane protein
MPFLGHWYALLVVLLFWAAVIALIVWVIRRLVSAGSSTSALSILNERFARGEIDQQEYEKRKDALKAR